MHFSELLKEKWIRIALYDKQYPKVKLGGYFRLEQLRIELFDAAKKHKKDKIKKIIAEIIEIQTGDVDTGTKRATLVMRSVFDILKFNVFENVPVFLQPLPKALLDAKNKRKDPETEHTKPRWEYDGRYITDWINTLASHYHWDLDKILNLDIDIAAHLIQEILLDEQMQREWEYQLTEVAYHYDAGTKKSKFVPLKRPDWMGEVKEIKTTKLIKAHLPYGVVGFGNVDIVSADEK